MKRGFGLALGTVVGIATVILVFSLLNGPGDKGKEKAIDGGTVIGKLQAQAKLETASRNYRTKVEFKDECTVPNPFGDDPVLPGLLCGTDSKFEVDGTVTFSVDLRSVHRKAIGLGGDGKVTIHLPQPVGGTPTTDKVDPLSSDRGILDRLASALKTDTHLYDKVVQQAKKQISRTARHDDEAMTKSRTEAQSVLGALLKSAGVKSVTVIFESPTSATS